MPKQKTTASWILFKMLIVGSVDAIFENKIDDLYPQIKLWCLDLIIMLTLGITKKLNP